MRFEPHECPHGRTRIEAIEDGLKSEECQQCGIVIEVHGNPTPICGVETADGHPCQRTVDHDDALCWQHEDDGQ